MQKRYLTLQCSQEEARRRLKMQMSPYALGGWVKDTQFKIYKQLPGVFAGNRMQKLLCCFYGDYLQDGKQIKIAYRIRPGFSLFLIYSMLALLTLYEIHQVLFLDEPIHAVIFSFTFLLVYHLIIHLKKKTCIADFENQLTTEIRHKK